MKRWLTLIGIAAALALGVGVALPPAAAHATISPLAPDPINILPSVVKAGTKGNAAQTYAMWNSIMINVLQQAQKSKVYWDYTQKVKTGTATVTEAQWLASQVKKINVPAFKPSGLIKGAGAAGVALFGFDAGFMVGDGALKLFGIDRTGTVCQESANAGEWLAFVGMADCTEFKKNAELVANQGFTPGLFGAKSCQTGNPNNCIWLVRGGKSNSVNNAMYCFKKSGANLSGNPLGTFSARPTPASLNWIASTAGDYTDICGGTIGSPDAAYVYHLKSYGDLLGYSIYDPANPNIAPTPVQSTGTDPERQFKCVVLGSNGVEYTAFSAFFKETDQVFPDPKCPDLPAGVNLERITITEEGGGETHIVYKEDATPESKGWRTTYPECADGTCMLDLLKNGKSCFVAPAACLDWFEDPNKAGTYECRYGGKVVNLSECNVYGPSFNGDPNVTGHPDTGKPFGDPKPKPDPKDPKTFDSKIQDPTKARQCFPQGWAVLNPVEWVTKPVQCALEWAFVPRASKVDEAFGNVQQRFANKMPMQLATAIAGWDFQPPPSGCNGIVIDVFFFPDPLRVMNACPGQPLAVLADISRIAGNLGFTVYGAIALTRHVARIFEFPGLGSSDD